MHLNVEWRDLADQDWNAALHLPDGRVIAARETPMLRASKVWRAAIDLNNGGRVKDIPETVQIACLGSPNRSTLQFPPMANSRTGKVALRRKPGLAIRHETNLLATHLVGYTWVISAAD